MFISLFGNVVHDNINYNIFMQMKTKKLSDFLIDQQIFCQDRYLNIANIRRLNVKTQKIQILCHISNTYHDEKTQPQIYPYNKSNNQVIYVMVQYMKYTVIIVYALLWASSTADIATCPCKHEGQCVRSEGEPQIDYCKCLPNFTDKYCSIQTQELTDKTYTLDVTQQYSYYHISFNNTILYLLQMFFCPTEYSQTTNFEIYIEFEQRDGAIDSNSTGKKNFKFQAGNNQCLGFRTLLSAPEKKYDSTSSRLVIRIRQMEDNLQKKPNQPILSFENLTNEAKTSKISIIIYKYEIYEMESLQIGQFFAISLFSALIILLFSYFLCRRTLVRRYRMFPYPAQLVQDISHFDTLMPTALQQQSQPLPQDAKQCMICLLDVDGTYTRTTPCRHLFHQECIDEWGKKSLTCPTCRSSLALPGQDTIEDLAD